MTNEGRRSSDLLCQLLLGQTPELAVVSDLQAQLKILARKFRFHTNHPREMVTKFGKD